MAALETLPYRRMDSYTRIGYSLEVKMTLILKRRDFARWQAGEKLPDAALCKGGQGDGKRSD